MSTADDVSVALATSAVILLAGLWFHRRRDRPVLMNSSSDVFTRPSAAAYVVVVAMAWLSTIAVTVAQLVAGRSEFQIQDEAIALPALVVVGAAVFIVFRTAHAIEAQDPEARGPVGQLGRFLRVGYGTSALAAFQYLRGRPYP